ncbi:MAG: hypothetical protein IPO62_17170 [Saprospiraceae bacterium]|nr:hypothetical protein [Saprospiraceae bacterium]
MKKLVLQKFATTHFLMILILMTANSCIFYRKINPPADADKPGGVGTDNSCYMATASNMLAGAGYGTGANLQARADDIYADMIAQFGILNGGWTDVALSWWLGSANNIWPTNPYQLVTVYGNKSPKNPWAEPDGPMFYGNELRRCCLTGLSISWPVAGATIGSGGHAITDWGDSGNNATLTTNPSLVVVTDSDTDSGGDEQRYVYDSYTSPNPGGANEGNGWYFSYSNNHPYIKHIVTLCPIDDPEDNSLTQRVTGSYTIPQNRFQSAIDLHYKVRTDVRILSYKTWLSWDTKGAVPTISESANKRELTVDWDLSKNPVPPGTQVTIYTEFILPYYNSMHYSDVYFTYPDIKIGSDLAIKFPEIKWKIESAELKREKLPNNVSGGFVIASFEIEDINNKGEREIYPYRLIHEYSYNQSPFKHLLQLSGKESVLLRNIKLGHSWNQLNTKELNKFENWISNFDTTIKLNKEPQNIEVDWQGKFEYPEGENIYQAIPDKNGRPRKPDSKKK